MSRIKAAAVTALLTVAGTLAMTACAPASENSVDGPPMITTSGSPATMQSESSQDATELLLLNDRLREELGGAYSQGWIESGKLHVAVTTEEAAQVVSDAGAAPRIVELNSQQLEDSVSSLAAWQGKLKPELATSIHRISFDGRTGTVTIAVAKDKIPSVQAALQRDDPTGKVPVEIVISDGLATPMDSTQTSAP
ncbi:hypothetical protein [Arthrobacter roseus]|uniref:hypothetical protein n=1 Tax=Arthrobacter roseus TaxID=136274 RepID=UPI00196564D7|nr:hypothetical protein [Arthrobacter roseus]MBM7849499.1 hypothetical protein [Arthrobacter roseus]